MKFVAVKFLKTEALEAKFEILILLRSKRCPDTRPLKFILFEIFARHLPLHSSLLRLGFGLIWLWWKLAFGFFSSSWGFSKFIINEFCWKCLKRLQTLNPHLISLLGQFPRVVIGCSEVLRRVVFLAEKVLLEDLSLVLPCLVSQSKPSKPSDKHLHGGSGVHVYTCIVHWFWRGNCCMTTFRLGFFSLFCMLMVLLILFWKVEAHLLVLVVTNCRLLGHIVEEQHWSCHFNFLLVLIYTLDVSEQLHEHLRLWCLLISP